jgi:apolipoprotein N-acyltransferase
VPPAALIALVAGAATVFGFAPFGMPLLPVVTLAALFHLWEHEPSPRRAAWIGFAFGMGLFGAGVSWVSIALHRFGGMPFALAAVATVGFCAFLALYPAVAGWAAVRLRRRFAVPAALVAPSLWTLAEWVRGWALSGFPWLSLGHSQVPGSPLAGFAPVGGTFGTSLAVAAVAGLAAHALGAAGRPGWRRRVAASLAAVAAIFLAGAALRTLEWTRESGEPVAVSLVQGNVEQEIKFDPAFRDATLEVYRGLVRQARGRLIVLPESALPMFAHEIPRDFAEFLADKARAAGGDLLFGVFLFSKERGGQYFNSVVSVGTSPTQTYRKRHLVPFGETIPLEPVTGWFIREVLHIPMADQTPGPPDQHPLEAAGQKIALGICYEDVFGAEVIPSLPEATLLVNVSNDAWYGRSIAAEQHHQIASARALETGRWMLRATQTGVTAIVDHRGRETARLPSFTAGVLEASVTGRAGATPYVRAGDAGAVAAALVLLALPLVALRRPPRPPAPSP